MLQKLKPYPNYKNSGDDCMGRVPSHWDTTSLGAISLRRSDRNRPDLPLLSVLREKGVVLRSSLAEDENHNFIPDDLSNYRIARAGDLVINKMKAWQGSVGIAPTDGIVSPAYFIFELSGISKEYAHRLLRSRLYADYFARSSDGVRIGQWDLSIDQMKRIPVVIPPNEEQNTLVLYLDAMDRRINYFIRNRRRLIEVLNEQKQAIINRAVTRGLDPNAKLKPSGIEWLGDIPENWNPTRLGRVINLITGFPFKSEGFTTSTNDVRLLRGINVSPGRIRWDSVVSWPINEADDFSPFSLVEGDLVLGMDRPVISGGIRVAIVTSKDVPSLLLQRVARLRSHSELDQDYLKLLLQDKRYADYLAPIFTGISVPHISPAQILDYRVVLPPKKDQEKIIAYVSCQTAGIATSTDYAEQEIALIREYRTRLIADVVTGKVDVRGLAVEVGEGEPEEFEEVLDNETPSEQDEGTLEEETDEDE